MTSNNEKKGVHYIACRQCQSCFHHLELKCNADLTDMQEYWDQDYITGGQRMHSVHMSALVESTSKINIAYSTEALTASILSHQTSEGTVALHVQLATLNFTNDIGE